MPASFKDVIIVNNLFLLSLIVSALDIVGWHLPCIQIHLDILNQIKSFYSHKFTGITMEKITAGVCYSLFFVSFIVAVLTDTHKDMPLFSI